MHFPLTCWKSNGPKKGRCVYDSLWFLLSCYLYTNVFVRLLFNLVAQAVDAALNEDQPSRALILSLRLNEDSLIKKCIVAVSPEAIPVVASAVPFRYLQRLIEAFAELLESCPHLEFILRWSQVCLITLCFHLTWMIGSHVCFRLSSVAGTLQSSWSFYPTELQKFASCSKIIAESNNQSTSRFGWNMFYQWIFVTIFMLYRNQEMIISVSNG